MIAPVTFIVEGRPAPWQRAARDRRSGRTFTPATMEAAKSTVAWAAQAAGVRMLDGPVRVDVLAAYLPPKKWSRARREAAMRGAWRPQKPDRDNLTKLIEDALTGIAYADDAQVVEGVPRKCWGPRDMTIITVGPAGAPPMFDTDGGLLRVAP